ncbi:hypothetical protein DYBT9275_01772 [Dyadobacter sp. CECT 9275]|uniref:Uncharacterized protein n=1 Tax=Dyadobacter helix TaxID=2822344 RepID=A0A916NKS9_9BACT|nr:cytochrome P450 [Dyadobacter sp. CECT 9275]CAG4997425.1 hypothetical protein DYBT9275_01772 [Dyadobacter sp. CECT 9275]
MKTIQILLLGLLCTTAVNAQDNFSADLKKLNSQIEAAHRSHKLSDNEYYKLKREQEVIKEAMRKYKADGYFSPEEKNRIYAKISRAKKRLARYKTNGERY